MPRGHSVVHGGEWFNVYCFAEPEHAEKFMHRFGGEKLTRERQQLGALEEVAQASYTDIVCGRVRLSSDYSEIKIRLKFAPDAGPSAPGERYTIACARDRYPQGRDQHRDHAFRINSFPGKSFGSSA